MWKCKNTRAVLQPAVIDGDEIGLVSVAMFPPSRKPLRALHLET